MRTSLLNRIARALHNHAAPGMQFQFAPGGLVHITCHSPTTSVEIGNAESEEHVNLQVQGETRDSRFITELMPGGRIIDVVESAAGSSSSDPVTLSATIPSRFCGLRVATAGGSVQVAQLQEAELQLLTRGGSVRLSRCRATNAAVSSAREAAPDPHQAHGGAIQVGELSAASVRLHSGGGPIRVRRLSGLEIDLLSGGGSLSLGALYGHKASANTGGGALHATHMACEGLAMLDTAGGPLTVEGCEGNASLLSGGGAIKVHLHEQFGRVFVDSAGGDVEALISPAAAVQLQVSAEGGIELDPALRVTGELGPTSLSGTTAGSSSSSSGSSGWPPHMPQPVALAGTAAHGASGGNSAGDTLDVGGEDRGSSGSSSSCSGSSRDGGMTGSSSSSSSVGHVGPHSTANASRLHRAAAELMQYTSPGTNNSGGGNGSGNNTGAGSLRQLVINAGTGRVCLRAAGWFDALRARLEEQKRQHKPSSAQ